MNDNTAKNDEVTATGQPQRCDWSRGDPLLLAYHDSEWGVPLHDDRKLFEFLILDSFQAGLSWSIILKKRDNFRRALADFDPQKVARFSEFRIKRILDDDGVIRNRRKIEAAVGNAGRYLKIQKEFGSFDNYLWGFVGGKTIVNRWKHPKELPAKSKESAALSSDLKKRGFTFVGPVICYAFMQAAGLVNDHLTYCFRYKELQGRRNS